jgi:long-chain acyl-CoA synthetase
LNCEYIAQIYVHGESLQSVLIAIVVPDPEKIFTLAKKYNIPTSGQTVESLCKNSLLKEKFLLEMTNTGKAVKLAGFEYVRNIYLEHVPFSMDNGLVTTSMKVKRNPVRDRYKQQIQQLYAELNKGSKL